MAADCNCPECGEYMGKDTECDEAQWCGNEGFYFYNARGDRRPLDELSDEARSVVVKGRRRGW